MKQRTFCARFLFYMWAFSPYPYLFRSENYLRYDYFSDSLFQFFFPSSFSKIFYFENPSLSYLGNKEQKSKIKKLFFLQLQRKWLQISFDMRFNKKNCKREMPRRRQKLRVKERSVLAQRLPWAWRKCLGAVQWQQHSNDKNTGNNNGQLGVLAMPCGFR